jgi:hypothetical protein
MAYRKPPRGPAGPAGNLGRPKSFHQMIVTWLAAHDRQVKPRGSSTPRRKLGREYVFPVARRTDS